MNAAFHRLRCMIRDWDGVAGVCIVLVTLLLVTLSVSRYTGYDARMFDLGNMSQAIWSSTQRRPLEFSYLGQTTSRLAMHAELIYFLLSPLYAVFPSPVTLLVAQALLFAAGNIPLYRLVYRRIGNRNAARLVTSIYMTFPVAQTAVLFDFHGDTLAMPLLLFALEALDRKAWRAYAVALLLALSCKVYIAASVCALGAFLVYKGSRRVGVLTLVLGFLWGAVVFLGLRPLFVASDSISQQTSAIGYAQFYFGELLSEFSKSWPLRTTHGLAVFAPVIPVALYVPEWIALALVVASPVLLSSGPGPSFHYGSHHYATVVPFLLWAVVEAASRLHRASSERKTRGKAVTWPIALGATLAMTLLLNMQLVNTPLSPGYWSSRTESGLFPPTFARTQRDALKDRWLAQNVPAEAALVASPLLAPHLANRHELHVARPSGNPPMSLVGLLDKVDYVVSDGLLDYVESNDRGESVSDVTYDWEVLTAALRREDFGLVSAQDGLLLLQKRAAGISDADWATLTLAQSVTATSQRQPAAFQAEFAGAVGLVEASVTHVRDRQYRLHFVWLALDGISEHAPLFAVTHLAGTESARMLHLPTLVLLPTTKWAPGDLITEEFEVETPGELPPGNYPLSVGWYDSSHAYAHNTDERSRVGELTLIGSLESGR